MSEALSIAPLPDFNIKEAVLNELETNDRYQFSITLYRKNAQLELEPLLESMHVNLEGQPTLKKLTSSTHLPLERLLNIVGTLHGYPYLLDATQFKLTPIIAKNPIVKDLLHQLNIGLVEVKQHLCLLIGSLEGIEYIEKNQNNKQCPINMFFDVEGYPPCILTGNPTHISELNKTVIESAEQMVFDLTQMPVLYDAFQTAVNTSSHKVRVTIDSSSNKITRLNSSASDATELIRLVCEERNAAHIISMMGSEQYQTSNNNAPFVKITNQNRAEHEQQIAYQCSSIETGRLKNIEFTLHPVTNDRFCKKTSPQTDDNISRIISLVKSAIEQNKPLIVQLDPKTDELRVIYACLHQFLHMDSMEPIYVNQKQVCYEGEQLLAIDFSNNKNSRINGLPFFGVIRNKLDAETCSMLVEDLNPLIAVTKSSKAQLPEQLTPYVKQLDYPTDS